MQKEYRKHEKWEREAGRKVSEGHIDIREEIGHDKKKGQDKVGIYDSV